MARTSFPPRPGFTALTAPVGAVATAKHWVGRTWLKVFGWRLESEVPAHPKFVVIAAPHTSGWDLPFMLATSYVLNVPISWMGKRELFAPPFGWFMRALGGIPIDRSKHHNTVSWAIAELEKSDNLVLSVPAKGTRGRAEYWKSGFYHIAKGANVPMALACLDYRNKCCGIGAFVMPTGDLRADMDRIRALYDRGTAKFPEMEGNPRLREEDEALAAPAVPAVLAAPPAVVAGPDTVAVAAG
jgi:1-acyl-sn-glycerol-3-phosphate acyltransferase